MGGAANGGLDAVAGLCVGGHVVDVGSAAQYLLSH